MPDFLELRPTILARSGVPLVVLIPSVLGFFTSLDPQFNGNNFVLRSVLGIFGVALAIVIAAVFNATYLRADNDGLTYAIGRFKEHLAWNDVKSIEPTSQRNEYTILNHQNRQMMKVSSLFGTPEQRRQLVRFAQNHLDRQREQTHVEKSL